MFKKYIYLFLWLYTSCITTWVFWAGVQDQMLPQSEWDNGVVTSKIWNGTWNNSWEDQIDLILVWVRDSIDTLLPIIAVGVFLFTWIRIAMARWNAEEFKKAFMQMVYAVIGIFIVWFAWAAVKLIAGLNI